MVDALLSDAPKFQPYASDLKTIFAQWSDAEAQLNPIVDRNPALHEIKPLTRDFSALGNAGLEALAYLSRNEAAPQEWLESKRTALDEAAKPKAALEFPVVGSVRVLVVAAAELPQLKTMAPVDWKKMVISKATVTPTK
jgi:hypothetical protein